MAIQFYRQKFETYNIYNITQPLHFKSKAEPAAIASVDGFVSSFHELSPTPNYRP